MSAFGIEEILDALEDYLKTNLGIKLTSINNEKGDSVLVNVDSNAYNKQFIESAVNYDPFLVFGVLDPTIAQSMGALVSQTYTIDVIIFFEQIDADTDYKKAFRYQRALKELITEGFNDIYRRTKFSVSGLAPVSVQISRDSKQHRATGVSLSVTLT